MINVLIVGVGGQGILLASEVLSKAAMIAGLDVKKSEVHGMSQRGGSVNSHIRFGEEVHSPLIPDGQADFVLALEKLEALRWEGFLRSGGTMIVNDLRIDPASVATGRAEYEKDIIARLENMSASENGTRVIVAEATSLALKAGDLRAINMVLLGTLSACLDFTDDVWRAAMAEHIKPEFMELNLKAFNLGRSIADVQAG